LKKRQYRQELKLFNERVMKLIDLAYRRHEKVTYVGQTLDINLDKIIFS